MEEKYSENLEDDLIQLYEFVLEEKELKQSIYDLRKDLKILQKNMNNVKKNILTELKKLNHSYAKFKDMKLTVHKKFLKTKLDLSQLSKMIEQIIDQESETIDKRRQILTIIKPRESGQIEDVLRINIPKNNNF